MKIKAIILSLFLMVSGNSFALGPNLPHPYDYALHAAGGYIITDLMLERGFSKSEILLTVAAVAIAKEMTDKNFDWNDAAAWMPGSIIKFSIPLD